MESSVLHPAVVATAKKLGVDTLNEIQKKSIPPILAGKDVLVVAPTGFGKTEAAIIPVFSELKKRIDAGDSWGIQAIYVTPLRALNRDILERLEKWCSELGISLSVRHGDTPQSQRAKQRENPPQFLITTPETLAAVLIAPKLSEHLFAVRTVVVDEYHELLEGKRGLQLGLSLARLSKKSGYPLQVVALSATLGDPAEAASRISTRAIAVETDERRKLDITVDTVERKAEHSKDSDSKETDPLAAKIASLVLSHKKTLVFCNTRSTVEWLGSRLHHLDELKGKIAVHHSSLSSAARKEAEDDFRKADGLRAIVCTSSLELGIDIGDIDLVIQVTSPKHATRLSQRVGRSGHRTHLIPKGIVLAGSAQDCAESAIVALRAKERKLERTAQSRPALDVLAHGLVGVLLDKEGICTLGEARDILAKCPTYSKITLANYVDLTLDLSKRRVLNLVLPENLDSLADAEEETIAKMVIRKMPRTRLFYYDNLSTIDDKKSLSIRNANSNKPMGFLDEDFAAQYLVNGATFISKGRPWKVLSVSDDEVAVEESNDYSAAIPEWRGEDIPVPAATARQVCELLIVAARMTPQQICEKYSCSPEAAKKIQDLASAQHRAFPVSPDELFCENLPNGRVILHSFLGDKFNEAFSIAIKEFMSSLKVRVRIRPDAYGIIFDFDNLDWDSRKLASLIEGLSTENFMFTLEKSIPNSPLMRAKFAHVAKRFGMISSKFAMSNRGAFLKSLLGKSRSTPAYEETLKLILNEKLQVAECRELYSHLRATGRTRITVIDSIEPSPLARALEKTAYTFTANSSLEPDETAFAEFTATLLEKTAGLVCTFCAHKFSKKLSEDADSKVACPYCGSSQIATDEYAKVLEDSRKKEEDAIFVPAGRKKRGQRRVVVPNQKSKADPKKVAEMHAVAALISSYGMRAVIALTVFGVGPETAARVLSRMHKEPKALLYDLLVAQKTFIRTKQFWKR